MTKSDQIPAQSAANFALIGAIVLVAAIGGFLFGYDSGVINGTQKGLESSFGLSRLGVGVNVGAILVGSALGAFGAGRLADRIGRRGVMIVAAVLFMASAAFAGAASSSIIFILARIVGGLAVGAASVTSPAYIAEIVPAHVRGRLATVQQVMIITGLTGAFVVNYLLAHFAGGSTAMLWLGQPAWRWMFWLQAAPAGIYFLLLMLVPESPRYLVEVGREADAERVLTRLFRSSSADKIAEIRASFAADHHKPRFADLIDPATGRLYRIVWAGLGLAIFQQLAGINVVFYYGEMLWQAVGFSESDALFTNILSGSISILACVLAMALVDKVGRKPLLLGGSLGMAASLFTVAYAFSTATHGTGGNLALHGHYGVIALVAANIFVFSFNMSWGPMMWVCLGEMFPNQIRGPGLAVAGFAQWIANAAISMSFPSLVLWPGLSITYFGYAAFAAISFLFVRKVVHETRGVELENMTR